jgi:hypothetical protein
MTQILTEDNVITLGAATEAILGHLYEKAQSRGDKRNYEDFIDHVLMRGKAEIERQWTSADKANESKAQAKVAAETYNYLKLKVKHGDTLSEPEQKFFDMMEAAMKATR